MVRTHNIFSLLPLISFISSLLFLQFYLAEAGKSSHSSKELCYGSAGSAFFFKTNYFILYRENNFCRRHPRSGVYSIPEFHNPGFSYFLWNAAAAAVAGCCLLLPAAAAAAAAAAVAVSQLNSLLCKLSQVVGVFFWSSSTGWLKINLCSEGRCANSNYSLISSCSVLISWCTESRKQDLHIHVDEFQLSYFNWVKKMQHK